MLTVTKAKLFQFLESGEEFDNFAEFREVYGNTVVLDEVTFTAFEGTRYAITARLIVRRVRDLNKAGQAIGAAWLVSAYFLVDEAEKNYQADREGAEEPRDRQHHEQQQQAQLGAGKHRDPDRGTRRHRRQPAVRRHRPHRARAGDLCAARDPRHF